MRHLPPRFRKSELSVLEIVIFVLTLALLAYVIQPNAVL